MKSSVIGCCVLLSLLAVVQQAEAQKPMRAGTTAANFLEIGFGAAGAAMGDAFVGVANDASALYWNPAGLALLEQSEVVFSYQPWLVDTKTTFAGAGLNLGDFGTLGIGLIAMDYGEMPVTTLAMQEGTGEMFSASDLAISISYARKLVTWFQAGLSFKYINSKIWHSNASALAFDLGVIIQTQFLTPGADGSHGLTIGMSIANYGTQMKYDGMDLMNPIDISPDEAGNYRDTPGQFRLQEWELPLIFRLGVSVTPIHTDEHELILAVDALHPNNNTESVNIGAQYGLTVMGTGSIYLRGGYKALFMEESVYGPTFGFGAKLMMFGNKGIKAEYAYRDMGIFGKVHGIDIGILF